jgi:hypothetical protein
LLQTDFEPDFVQVRAEPLTVVVCPTDLQVSPIFTAAVAGTEAEVKVNIKIKVTLINFLTQEAYYIQLKFLYR